MDKLKLIEAILESSCGEETKQKQSYPFKVGDKVYLRTVTYHQVGRVKQIIGKFLMLENASWVADSGRFMNALKDGTLSEVEPVVDGGGVNIDSIVDFFPWSHELPKEQR